MCFRLGLVTIVLISRVQSQDLNSIEAIIVVGTLMEQCVSLEVGQ